MLAELTETIVSPVALAQRFDVRDLPANQWYRVVRLDESRDTDVQGPDSDSPQGMTASFVRKSDGYVIEDLISGEVVAWFATIERAMWGFQHLCNGAPRWFARGFPVGPVEWEEADAFYGTSLSPWA